MGVLNYGVALLTASLIVVFLHQHGEFHWSSGTLAVAAAGGYSPQSCVDATDVDAVMDLVLLPSGGVLVASMSANLSQPGRIYLLPSGTFSIESGAPEFRSVSFSGFSAQSLRPQSMHLLSHSEGLLLFVVQQWPATNSAFERYMQQRGAKGDEGLPQPLSTVEVFLVVQDQATEVQLIHQRSLQHVSLHSITGVVALSPKQLFVSTSCYSHAASWWKRALETLSSLACCSKIWLLDVDCGSEENCFDTHLGGELTGLAPSACSAVVASAPALMSFAASVVAEGLRNVQGISLTANKQHLIAAESTARSLAVFRAQPEDGRLLPVAAVPLHFVPSRLSVSHSRLLAVGHVQGLRSVLLGYRKLPIDSRVAVVPSLDVEQCSPGAEPGDAFAAQALLDMKGLVATASLFATENVLVIGTESRGVRVCFKSKSQ